MMLTNLFFIYFYNALNYFFHDYFRKFFHFSDLINLLNYITRKSLNDYAQIKILCDC